TSGRGSPLSALARSRSSTAPSRPRRPSRRSPRPCPSAPPSSQLAPCRDPPWRSCKSCPFHPPRQPQPPPLSPRLRLPKGSWPLLRRGHLRKWTVTPRPQGQGNGADRPIPRRALERDLPTVGLDDALGNAQPQAGAAHLP